MNNGLVKVPGWTPEIWASIDEAVHAEGKRTKIAAKFLGPPVMVDPSTLTVPSDTVHLTGQVLDVDPVLTTPIVEIQVLFMLTSQQVEKVALANAPTAITLATRAANLLSQGEDLLILQGQDAADKHSLFRGVAATAEPRKVQVKSGRPGKGLLNLPDQTGANLTMQALRVAPKAKPTGSVWGEEIFGQVAKAYAQLQGGQGLSQAHYGPYALVLNYFPYADTFAPLPTTLILTADRIKPLVTSIADGKCHFYGTGTVPTDSGVFVSVGGNTLDLVMAQDATTECVQIDTDGYYRFRVFERFAVREKDVSCVVRLEFSR